MKKTFMLFALLLVLSPMVSFAQDETDKVFDRVKVYTKSSEQPTFVLKVEGKTLIFNDENRETINLKEIDPDTIQEIQVLRGEAAAVYNDVEHGVVMITFKNLETLKPSLKKKFEAL